MFHCITFRFAIKKQNTLHNAKGIGGKNGIFNFHKSKQLSLDFEIYDFSYSINFIFLLGIAFAVLYLKQEH